MGMRGSMDMKGGNYRGNNDSWGGNSGVYSIHMRGLPFKATEQDIADVILIVDKPPFFRNPSLIFSCNILDLIL